MSRSNIETTHTLIARRKQKEKLEKAKFRAKMADERNQDVHKTGRKTLKKLDDIVSGRSELFRLKLEGRRWRQSDT